MFFFVYTSCMKNKYFSTHKFIPVIIVIAVLLIALIGWKLYSHTADSSRQSPLQISTFDECVAAGNAIMESYPEQCMAGDKTFIKEY